MSISVVLAVFNEEDVLAACLASVKDLADEIVIVDGGSTDRTVEIAKQFGAKVFVTDNPPVFHINKQRAVDRARGDWIFQLDADEVVPVTLKEEIRAEINTSEFNGYYVPRKNYFLWYWMRKGGQYPDYVVRLFRKGKGYFPQKSVHEQVVIDGKIGYLNTPLEHRPYKTFGEYWQKAHTYATLEAREMASENLVVTTAILVQYNIFRPVKTFLNLFVRHKGFMDGVFGLLFALFSAYQEPLALKKYIQYEKLSTKEHWQSYWKTPDHQPPVVHEEMLEELRKVVSVKGKKILEVGAGMGGDSVYLAKQGAFVTALDYTDEALGAIREHAKKEGVELAVKKGDTRQLPFKDESYDVVFHQGLLEHFRDPLAILEEHVRVLKKGGILVVDVPQKFTTYTIKKKIAIVRGMWFAGWERAFSIGELEHLMREVSLTVVRSYGWGYYGQLHALRNLKLGDWYESLWRQLERSRTKLYFCWCIGVIGQK